MDIWQQCHPLMSEKIEREIKDAYNRLPYPGIDDHSIDPTASWSWVNIDWMGALMPVALNTSPSFKRILIAGCGTGNEAFQMKNSFPNAEITAVDYSKESISIAQKYQNENPGYADINFEVDDLTVGTGGWMKADYYDFISCHGVISYIPNAQDVFNQLANCLAKDGICYIGVNGAAHFGVKLRESLQHLGYKVSNLKNTLEARRVIELLDRLSPQQIHASLHTPTYIDSDLLNTFSQNLTFSEWTQIAENSGMHLLGSAELIPNLSKTLSPNVFPLLFPRSRKELCELVAINNVASFHKLVFGKEPIPSIPWSNTEALLDCDFQTTSLYSIQRPASEIYGELILNSNITHGYDVSLRWPIDDIYLKLTNQKIGTQTIREALKEHIEAYKDDQQTLLVKLFMLYQLGIIKILLNVPNRNTKG